MKFFKLTREKPSTGLFTIKPNDQMKVVNISSNIPLIIEFSTTDNQKETMPLTDEVSFQNSASYLRRQYFRMEIMIAEPTKISFSEEVYCKLFILDQ